MGIPEDENTARNGTRVLAFFILAFAIGGGTIALVVAEILPGAIALSAALSASIAAVILSILEGGKAGLVRLFRSIMVFRVGIGYWLFAFLFVPFAVPLGLLLNPLFGANPAMLRNFEPSFNIVSYFVIFFVVAGLGQELGWTAYLMPRLQVRFHRLISAIIRAFLWWGWHLPLLIYSRNPEATLTQFPYSGWIAQKGFLPTIAAVFFLFVLPWSVIYTWLYNRTRGSALLVAVLHGSEIWTAFWLMSVGLSPDNLDNYLGFGVLLIVTMLTLAVSMVATGSVRQNV